jgi:hypothetical protein
MAAGGSSCSSLDLKFILKLSLKDCIEAYKKKKEHDDSE